MWHKNARRKSSRTFTWSVRKRDDTLSPTSLPDHINGTRQACIAFTQSECCRFRNLNLSSLNRQGGFCIQSLLQSCTAQIIIRHSTRDMKSVITIIASNPRVYYDTIFKPDSDGPAHVSYPNTSNFDSEVSQFLKPRKFRNRQHSLE